MLTPIEPKGTEISALIAHRTQTNEGPVALIANKDKSNFDSKGGRRSVRPCCHRRTFLFRRPNRIRQLGRRLAVLRFGMAFANEHLKASEFSVFAKVISQIILE
ncbi:hypothetical protein LIER_39641 [Lithospermum erythrorhizon]|uniref:Uncharacterized protein n=1 Tax=Lithospermum erythrorhizon TaxID=34254 RepID=A0AAV3QLR3_LITER